MLPTVVSKIVPGSTGRTPYHPPSPLLLLNPEQRRHNQQSTIGITTVISLLLVPTIRPPLHPPLKNRRAFFCHPSNTPELAYLLFHDEIAYSHHTVLYLALEVKFDSKEPSFNFKILPPSYHTVAASAGFVSNSDTNTAIQSQKSSTPTTPTPTYTYNQHVKCRYLIFN